MCLADILIKKGLKFINIFKSSHTHKDKKKRKKRKVVLSSQDSSK